MGHQCGTTLDEPRDNVRSVAVIGIGTMGSTIAWLFARHGVHVVVTDVDDDAIASGLARIRARARTDLGANLEAVLREYVTSAVDIETAVRGADLVIEAASEHRDVKESVLRRAGASLDAASILASNTSSFPINVLADFLPADIRDRFLGIHFFNPADLVPGVEVIRHEGTDRVVINTCMSLMRRMGKQPSLVNSSPGFVANRLQLALFKEAVACVDEGIATPDEIDSIVSNSFGYRLPAFGPFQIADMAGLDVYAGIFDVLERAFGSRFRAPESFLTKVRAGRLGLKSGLGYWTYTTADVLAVTERRDAAYRAIARALKELDEFDLKVI